MNVRSIKTTVVAVTIVAGASYTIAALFFALVVHVFADPVYTAIRPPIFLLFPPIMAVVIGGILLQRGSRIGRYILCFVFSLVSVWLMIVIALDVVSLGQTTETLIYLGASLAVSAALSLVLAFSPRLKREMAQIRSGRLASSRKPA